MKENSVWNTTSNRPSRIQVAASLDSKEELQPKYAMGLPYFDQIFAAEPPSEKEQDEVRRQKWVEQQKQELRQYTDIIDRRKAFACLRNKYGKLSEKFANDLRVTLDTPLSSNFE